MAQSLAEVNRVVSLSEDLIFLIKKDDLNVLTGPEKRRFRLLQGCSSVRRFSTFSKPPQVSRRVWRLVIPYLVMN